MAEDTPRADIEALLRVAGFAPNPTQMAEIEEAWPQMKAMLDRLHRDFGFADEPAHAFDPTRL